MAKLTEAFLMEEMIGMLKEVNKLREEVCSIQQRMELTRRALHGEWNGDGHHKVAAHPKGCAVADRIGAIVAAVVPKAVAATREGVAIASARNTRALANSPVGIAITNEGTAYNAKGAAIAVSLFASAIAEGAMTIAIAEGAMAIVGQRKVGLIYNGGHAQAANGACIILVNGEAVSTVRLEEDAEAVIIGIDPDKAVVQVYTRVHSPETPFYAFIGGELRAFKDQDEVLIAWSAEN